MPFIPCSLPCLHDILYSSSNSQMLFSQNRNPSMIINNVHYLNSTNMAQHLNVLEKIDSNLKGICLIISCFIHNCIHILRE